MTIWGPKAGARILRRKRGHEEDKRKEEGHESSSHPQSMAATEEGGPGFHLSLREGVTRWLKAPEVPGTDAHLCPPQVLRSKKSRFPNVETHTSFPGHFRGELRIPPREIVDLMRTKSPEVFLKIIWGGKWACWYHVYFVKQSVHWTN